jgi:hypothetical protein
VLPARDLIAAAKAAVRAGERGQWLGLHRHGTVRARRFELLGVPVVTNG